MRINEIRPFVPSRDYEESKLFYESLGFKGESAGADLTIFEKDGCTFFLQRFYSEELASNLMFQLVVDNIDLAYEQISGLNGVKHTEIKNEPWGAVVYLWGPSGELWHITELAS